MTEATTANPVFRKGDRVRVIDNSRDPNCYQVGWVGTVMGCGIYNDTPMPSGPIGRIGVHFDPGQQPPSTREYGNLDLGDGGGNIRSGFRWTVPKNCLVLSGPTDFLRYDEGGVV